MSEIISKEQQQIILERFKKRLITLNIKFKTERYYREQASFVAGAATALDVVNKELPPFWALACMSDREIIQQL